MASQTMRALVYEGPRRVEMRRLPVPAAGDGEVLVRVAQAGICGSELSGYLGHNSLRKPPLVMGHEFSGIVAATGPGATRFAPGERVTVNPLVTCGECRYCRNGRSQLCGKRQLLGAHRPGAFAEYVTAPERNVHRLSDNMTMTEGTYVEPLACAVHVGRLLQAGPTDRLVVYGAGPIGLLAVQTALAYGLRDVVVVDLNESRLEIARELGALAAAGLSAGQWGEFDAAIDAVGASATRQACVRAVRPGGRVVFTGLHEAESALPINDMIRNEIVALGAFGYSQEDFGTALSWIAQGRATLTPWTEVSPMENGGACFEKLIGGPGKVAKIVLDPGGTEEFV